MDTTPIQLPVEEPVRPEPVVRTTRLTKIYGNKTIALNDFTLDIPTGSTFGLLGPNGAGKTTFLRLLLGLHRPTAGRIEVFGEPMRPNSARLRQRIGFLPTNPQFPKSQTPLQYLDFLGRLFGMPSELRRPRMASLLQAVGLSEAAGTKIGGFSTGMTTRLGLAASLINDPALLIWDEPTAGLDPQGRRHTLDLIKTLSGRPDRTVILCSHVLGDIDRVCSHAGIIYEGKLVCVGTTRDLKRRYFGRSLTVELDATHLQEEALSDALPRSDYQWKYRNGRLDLTLVSDDAFAPAVARLMGRLEDLGVEVLSVRTEGDAMENAFLGLLKEDQEHGFQRAFDPAQR